MKWGETRDVSPTLLSCSSRFLRALQQNRAQSRLLYLLKSRKKFSWEQSTMTVTHNWEFRDWVKMAILNAVHKILSRMLFILLLEEITEIQIALKFFKTYNSSGKSTPTHIEKKHCFTELSTHDSWYSEALQLVRLSKKFLTSSPISVSRYLNAYRPIKSASQIAQNLFIKCSIVLV